MAGMYIVSLSRVIPRCPVCHARRTAKTHPFNGTVIDTTCRVETCSIARRLLFAGKLPGGEIQPVDDRHTSRARFVGGAM